MIICPSRKPRSTVRGPTRSLNENVSPGLDHRAVDVLRHQLHVVDPVRRRRAHVGREGGDLLADAELLRLAVVRSARICFRRSDARCTGAAAAAAIESAAQRPSTASPGREGSTRTLFPSTTKRALTARARHGSSIGSTAFATRSRVEEMRKLSPSGRKRSSFASRAGAKRADVLALEGERHRLVDERLGLGDRGLGCGRRQLGLDVRQRGRERPRAGERRLERAASGASTASPGRDGDDPKPLRTTTCARRGFGSAAETRAATSSSSGRATRTGSTTRAGGLGSTSVRIRPTKLRAAGIPERLLQSRRRRPERLGRPYVVCLRCRRRRDRLLQLRLAQLDARQRPIPVVRRRARRLRPRRLRPGRRAPRQ